ncbi:ATP-binding protein [Streptomyces sp. NRRL WC-3618]|uniref:ATP-binding protein n=1 Tax=Streptomyces sp. NRRL WC-3618 TaxID=1519490 RepID=UPI000AF943E6|nr:ATP-binding protein [Streptomyces sp. NRRL WC-3618]
MTAKAPEDTDTPIVKEWNWTRHDKCAWLSRCQLRKQLAVWEVSAFEDIAVLLFSELFTNALRNSPRGREIQTRFMLYSDRLRIEVADTSEKMPQPRTAGDDEESGRGLVLVEALADKWGVEPRSREGQYAPGKTVWFELCRA